MESRLEMRDKHNKFSEIPNFTNISIDEIDRIRAAMNRSQMDPIKNRSFNTSKNSNGKIKNRSILYNQPM